MLNLHEKKPATSNYFIHKQYTWWQCSSCFTHNNIHTPPCLRASAKAANVMLLQISSWQIRTRDEAINVSALRISRSLSSKLAPATITMLFSPETQHNCHFNEKQKVQITKSINQRHLKNKLVVLATSCKQLLGYFVALLFFFLCFLLLRITVHWLWQLGTQQMLHLDLKSL